MRALLVIGFLCIGSAAQAEVPNYRGYAQYTFDCEGYVYTVKVHDHYVGETYDVIREEGHGEGKEELNNLPEWEGKTYLKKLRENCGDEVDYTFVSA